MKPWPGIMALLALAALAAAGAASSLTTPGSAIPSDAMPGATGGALLMSGAGGMLFQSGFDPENWSGSLTRRDLSIDSDGQIQAGEIVWNAGDILTGDAASAPPLAAHPAPAARQIYTVRRVGAGHATIPFEWASLSYEQRALLDVAFGSSVADGLGERRLNYVRGERGSEIGRADGVFRPRVGVLGAAVHGAPLYVGAPSTAVPGGAYGAFYESHKTRAGVVYLGTDDGMLHAFDAADGVERFAYVPDALIGALNQLADRGAAHRPYVDGTPGAGEALLPGGWATVLASSMGAGAQGAFALDVTDPEHFAAGAGALWEFTDRDDPAIGNAADAPAIAKLRTGTAGGVPRYRYFAVLASGFNNEVDDGAGRFLRAPAGVLFLLALDKPATQPWRAGVNYYKLITPVSGPGARHALGPPALVAGADGALRYAYAGDLQGNLWRFDFSGPAPWSVSGGAAGAQPLYVARDPSGARQAITRRPQVAYAAGGGYLILFGAGNFSELGEEGGGVSSGFQQQSIYAIHDAAGGLAPVSGRDVLLARGASVGADGAAVVISGDDALPGGAPGAAGWYLDLPLEVTGGERPVSAVALADGMLFLNAASAAGMPRTYALDSLSGLALDAAGVARSGATTGQLGAAAADGAPLVALVSARPDAPDATRRGAVDKTYRVFNSGKAGLLDVPGEGGKLPLSTPAGRMSWREVANWPELHDAASE